MAESKYLLMRNVPALPSKNASGYTSQLKSFFKRFSLCPKCEGSGTNDVEIEIIEGCTNIRVAGFSALEQIRENEIAPITQVIRDILEYQCQEKVSCKMCHGFRFVKRSKTSGKEKIQSRQQAKKKVDSKSKKTTR